MSNSRSKSQYLPMVAYVAARQMAKRGDLWPYSTRATEARGGLYKRLKKVTCQRKRAAELGDVVRAVRNEKLGVVEFKKQRYDSSTSKQLLRGAAAQEASAHRSGGRSRLKTTGRKTLTRTLPKWEEEAHPLPKMGCLLDVEALKPMLARAASFFAGAEGFPAKVPLEALRRAASS